MLNRYKKKRDLFEVVIIMQVIEMFKRLSFLNVKKTSSIYIVYIDAFCPYHLYKQHEFINFTKNDLDALIFGR